MKQEKGKWEPYNIRTISSNIELVFKKQDIFKLNKPTYNFIVCHMGFIAHYNLGGFQHTYQDLREFAIKLQSSEYSNYLDYNLQEAKRLENDKDFREWYGEKYNRSKANAIRLIIGVVRKYESKINTVFTDKERIGDLVFASKLAGKHG